jgi:chromosome segregation ATPase
MPRKALHTEQQVFEAADKIAASGQEVTPTVLRTALGGGSLTTIYKHLEAWAKRGEAAPVQSVFEMPESVSSAFNLVWQTAANAAAKEVASIREKADIEVKAATRRFDEAIANIAQLETEAEADAARIEALEAQLAADKLAADAAATLAASNEAALRATVEQMGRQIEGQEAELRRVHAEQDQAREAHSKEVTRLTGDFARQLAEHTDAARAAQAETAGVRTKLEEVTETLHQSLERERTSVKSQTVAEGEAARLKVQITDMEGRHQKALDQAEDRHKQALDQAAAERSTLDAALRQEREQVDGLKAKLHTATGECEALRAQVQSQLAMLAKFTPDAAAGAAAGAAPAAAAPGGQTGKPGGGRNPPKSQSKG